MFREFKEFVARGNVIDLAVAVIIGAAFGKIVTSFVEDILMPFIGIFGTVDWSDMAVRLGTGETAPVLRYGVFVTNVVNFLIIAFALFLVIRAINRVKRPDEIPTEEPNKQCPYCFSSIPKQATRCAACTSPLETAPVA